MREEAPLEIGSTDYRWRTWLKARLITLAHVYFTCLFIWVILRFFFQDRWSWLFLVSALAVYLFLPLPLLLLTVLWVKRRGLWLGFLLALALWLALYGQLFLPRLTPVQAGGHTLTVMTYNLLGFNQETEAVISALRRSEADVIGLGELNPAIGAAIGRELIDRYPYQVLNPQPDVSGTGVISRYPLQPTGQTLAGEKWVGEPQILTLDFQGNPVLLIHFHAIPLGTTGGLSGLIYSVHIRQAQAQAIVDLAAAQEHPVLVLGDLNANDQHKAYRIMTTNLIDSWREAGRGLGHTFPGAASHRSSRPVILGIPAPMWMVRIDYIFHSQQWQAESAWIGPWEGVSDHRPVVARLSLIEPGR